MTAKDWIILFTPIVCNGIFLHIMQMHLKQYLDRKDRVREQNNSAYRQLLECLAHAQKSLYSLTHNQYDIYPERFNSCFNDVASNIHEIRRINDANIGFYSEFSENLTNIYDTWDSTTSFLEGVISNQDGTLTAHDSGFLSKNFRILYETISALHNKVSKRIL